MKKIFPLFLVMLMLTSCASKLYTPTLTTTFSQNAVVKVGGFSYQCKISRNSDKCVVVDVLSSSAKGMKISFDGKTVTFLYDAKKYQIDGKKVDKTNIAVAVYDAFYYFESQSKLDAEKVENGYKYVGRTSLGKFRLIQNDDESLNSFLFQSTDLAIEFE